MGNLPQTPLEVKFYLPFHPWARRIIASHASKQTHDQVADCFSHRPDAVSGKSRFKDYKCSSTYIFKFESVATSDFID